MANRNHAAMDAVTAEIYAHRLDDGSAAQAGEFRDRGILYVTAPVCFASVCVACRLAGYPIVPLCMNAGLYGRHQLRPIFKDVRQQLDLRPGFRKQYAQFYEPVRSDRYFNRI